MEYRQVSTTTYPVAFFMVLASDHVTPATGLTPVVTLSKNGGTFAAAAGAVSELGGGWYALAGNATDRNTLGNLVIHAAVATADNADKVIQIVSYNPFASVSTSTLLGNTLADAMLDVARLLGGLRNSVATGGSTTTLIDTSRTEEAEYWKNGTIWITSGANIGTCARITSFIGNTLTLNTTLTAAIAAGVEYSILPPEFEFDHIRFAIQSALSEIGDVISIDETLTTDTDDEVYALPTGVYNVFRVEIAGNTADPYNYARSYFWKELGGYLYFEPSKKPAKASYKMRVWYKAAHPEVFSTTDTIQRSVDRTWLKWAAVAHVLRNKIALTGKDKAINIDLLNQAMQKEEMYKARIKRSMLLDNPDPRFGT